MEPKPVKVWVDIPEPIPESKRKLDLGLINPKYVPDQELKDSPSRLFRNLLRAMDLNTGELMTLIEDYLKWEIVASDPKRVKELRTSSRGNIKSGYFGSDTMTMSKLLGGLSILKATRCKITLEVEFADRDPITIEERVKIHSALDQ